MIVAFCIAAAWCLVGVLTVPWVIGEMNRRGDSMIREPALEAILGMIFGPIPLLMFVGYFMLRCIGRLVYRITSQSEDTH